MRKRMIDPRIWDSEQVQSLSPVQFKLYLFLISASDDHGRFKVSFPMIAAKAFPMDDDYTKVSCQDDVVYLHRCGLITLYKKADSVFGSHPNWKTYQTINRPQETTIPSEEECEPWDQEVLAEKEVTGDHNTFSERSVNDHVSITPNRIEEKRIEEKRKEVVVRDHAQPSPLSLMKDDLAQQYQEAFSSMTPPSAWKSIPKERASLAKLAELTKKLSQVTDQPPDELAPRILEAYRQRRQFSRADYWAKAPMIPSALVARWDDVVTSMAEEAEELQEVVF